MPGLPECRAVDFLRPAPADIADDELQGAADRAVGAVALAQRVALGVHADLAADRAVDDDAPAPTNFVVASTPCIAKMLVEHRLDRRQHDRQVFRLAAGHHRVDRDFFDRRPASAGGTSPTTSCGIAAGAVEHAQHALLGRRHQRQPVRPAAREHRLVFVLVVAQFDAARFEAGLVEADLQVLEGAGLDVLRAAAGAKLRQAGADALEAADAFPLAAIPAIGAVHLQPIGAADQGRHDLDLQRVRDLE